METRFSVEPTDLNKRASNETNKQVFALPGYGVVPKRRNALFWQFSTYTFDISKGCFKMHLRRLGSFINL